ncbi:MAG: alcohol dehydrogenase catalytic domain-containing protein [Ardenticatenaceae bacterium]|nr:alcohol dehydrogenase catalytic domain-containing protein [Anaerolineales bacterium]MCB8923953.1 alcohol dehydrogenase catalytic domain-containing protein [Ardenticatenaceae bacterium]MCB8990151.1 alcohol dehydrogenase catalytic domain-containing protein [Ardenticatenaceae bacterium]MCB9005453.1 alcohol dehydrogenase catalytic domain-containing protein [Ardenticatenaceae bacterium]
MQALYLADGQLQYMSDYAQPQPQANEALLRVRLAGICTTDLELLRGYVPGFHGVPGHEFVGEVVSSADKVWHGRRVVGSINIGCGDCAVCHSDGPEHCPNRRALGIHNKDGAFADYLTLPLSNLYVVPDGVADETAVFTEPLAAALRIREQALVRPTARTAVIGPGRLGLLIGQVMALGGTNVTMIGRHAASLQLPAHWGLNTAVVGTLPDNNFDLVVDATGNEAGFAEALRLVRPLGTIVLKSTYAGAANMDLSKLVVDEITVIGSRCGPFAPALRLLAQNAIDVASMIDGEYPLHDGAAAFAHAAQSGVRKVLLRP